MRSLGPTLIKSAIFIVVTVLATGILLITISNPGGTGKKYAAEFSDVTALTTGDDVRMAGVRVGEVTGIHIYNHDHALVDFTVQSNIQLDSTVNAAIKYRNLVGQRYLDIAQGSGSTTQAWPANTMIGLDRTTPALDLTALFNGFQPLFKALDPGEVNQLSYEVVQIFQGQGATVTDLLTQTASLTSTLANKDAIIGQVIDNLNNVLGAINAHNQALGTTIDTLQQLVSGLAEDRQAIGAALPAIADLTTSVSGLLQNGRPALQQAIDSLGALSGNLSQSASLATINSFLQHFPSKVNDIARTASYGSWVNAYVCQLTPITSSGVHLSQTNTSYVGYGVGVAPAASRCSG